MSHNLRKYATTGDVDALTAYYWENVPHVQCGRDDEGLHQFLYEPLYQRMHVLIKGGMSEEEASGPAAQDGANARARILITAVLIVDQLEELNNREEEGETTP